MSQEPTETVTKTRQEPWSCGVTLVGTFEFASRDINCPANLDDPVL